MARLVSDDDWDWEESVSMMTGAAHGTGIPPEEPPESDHYLYLPDLSAETGWIAHRVRMDPAIAMSRRIGFRMQRRRR